MSEPAIRVLLVDDDEFAFKVVRNDLAGIREGYFEVEWRADFGAGLEALRSRSHDVCLLDFQLGDRSGLDLLKDALADGCQIPVVMLTAKGDHQTDVEAMRVGATDYLVKGEFGPELLERSLRYAVERSRTLTRLKKSEERFQLAVAGANDGIWDWSIATNEVYFSPRWKAILGWSDPELSNHIDEWYVRVHPDDTARLRADMAAHIKGISPHMANEHRILHKDGNYRWVTIRALAVRGPDGQATRLAGSMQDITHDRGHDALTELPNRVLYLDRLARVIERAKRHERYDYAVLFIDLDRFKIVNDSLGHLVGDELLIGISRRFQSCVRSADTVARFGGDEFTILLEDISDAADATRVASRIQRSLGKPFNLGGREVYTTASIGIAIGGPGYHKPEELLRDADTAMYRAKVHGKARHEVFDQKMHDRAVAMLQLESDLRRATETHAFDVHYQPVIALDSGAIVSFEALIRWTHPSRGRIAPDAFIPLAEETGLIVEIDRWIRTQAFTQLSAWRQRFPAMPLSMAVNVTQKDLEHPRFVEEVEELIQRLGLPPESLHLEITESAIMENPEAASAVFARLRPRGVQLAMDDFGTGYSSLSYLNRLPFTALKIDRSFVMRLATPQDTTEMVRAIITLSKDLKLTVVAEGVETAEQLAVVRALGCHRAQGYFFSKPLESAAAEKLLAGEPRW